MTIKKARKLTLTLVLAGFGLLLLAELLEKYVWAPLGLGFALCVAGLVIQMAFVRCPACGARIVYHWGVFPEFCSKCGQRIDENSAYKRRNR